MMLRCAKGEMGEIILDSDKIRDGEPFEPIHLFLQSTDVGTDSEGKPVKSATLIPYIPGIFAESSSTGRSASGPPSSKVSKGHKLKFFQSAFGKRSPFDWVHKDVLFKLWKKETKKGESSFGAFLTEFVKATCLERGKGDKRGQYRPTQRGRKLLPDES